MTTIENLDKAFESRVRLGIMSVLTGAGQSDFNTLKSMLGVSDGNLASHIKALEVNIRTGLKDARVEVYDMNGRMVYGQEITDNVTTITTTSWPSGTYIWKVIANGRKAETGKWIKE